MHCVFFINVRSTTLLRLSYASLYITTLSTEDNNKILIVLLVQLLGKTLRENSNIQDIDSLF